MKTCRFGVVFGSRGGSGQRLVVCSNQPIRADCSAWRVDGLNRRRAGASLPCSQRVFRDGCEKVEQKARCIDRSPLSRLRPTSAAAAPLYLVCPRPEARSPKVKARRHASPCRAPAGRASRPGAVHAQGGRIGDTCEALGCAGLHRAPKYRRCPRRHCPPRQRPRAARQRAPPKARLAVALRVHDGWLWRLVTLC